MARDVGRPIMAAAAPPASLHFHKILATVTFLSWTLLKISITAMNQPDILVVEDDADLAAALRQGFEQDSHSVTLARDGEEGLRLARERRFHAIVLDVMLPLVDGFTLATTLRQSGNQTPILMLTARDSVADVVRGLDCGVEDYLTKPFSFLELAARIRALIRRGQPPDSLLRAGDLVMERNSHHVSRGGIPLDLTKTEYRLLEVLLKNAGHVVRRRDLLDSVWGSLGADDNNLDVAMSGLRVKVDKGQSQRLIQTVRGFGYKIANPERP